MEFYLSKLAELISFRSISTDPQFESECKKAAQWLVALFKEHGLSAKLLPAKEANPLVFAATKRDSKKKTVLVYGHYDVQPADQAGWKSDPFTLTPKGGRLFGRGTMDNKGQVFVHIASILELLKEGKLGYNVIFLIEGDEESGNQYLAETLKKYRDLLKADVVFVSDGELSQGAPAFERSFRAAANMTLEVRTAPNDLHSGIYGGAIPNALGVLTDMLATLVHPKTRDIQVEGMYESIIPVTEEVSHDSAHVLKTAGVRALLLREGYTFDLQVGTLPSIEITGISGGYTGAGYQNIIPAIATARLNVRIAPGQKTKDILSLVQAHIQKISPEYARARIINVEAHGNPIVMKDGGAFLGRAVAVARNVYTQEPKMLRQGASIPIIGLFQDVLKLPVVSMGLSNEDSNIHGANENFTLAAIKKGYEFSKKYFAV